jgi:tRNA(fMet)-specific endonuclease VapC
MQPALVDTDILSLFFRDHPTIKTHFETYLQAYPRINLSIITYFEIVSGLKHRDARKQLSAFLDFVHHSTVLPLNESSAMVAAEIYADLRKRGQPIADIDILIAGIAQANGLVLITHNLNDFSRVTGLAVEDWSQ